MTGLETIDNAKPSEFKIINYKGQCYLQINVNDDEATQIQLPLLEDETQDVQLAIDKFKQINRAKPSEAMECLERIKKYISDKNMHEDLKLFDGKEESNMYYNGLGIIKQALIKAQEQEKVLEILFEKEVDIGLLMNCATLDEYCYHYSNSQLISQEFDLLKRWTNGTN